MRRLSMTVGRYDLSQIYRYSRITQSVPRPDLNVDFLTFNSQGGSSTLHSYVYSHILLSFRRCPILLPRYSPLTIRPPHHARPPRFPTCTPHIALFRSNLALPSTTITINFCTTTTTTTTALPLQPSYIFHRQLMPLGQCPRARSQPLSTFLARGLRRPFHLQRQGLLLCPLPDARIEFRIRD